MEESTAERIRAGYEAWNRHGIEAIFAFLDPDIEWVQDPEFPGAATYRGHSGVRAWAENLGASWDIIRVNVEEMLERGDHALAIVRLDLHGRGSGIDMATPLGQLWSFRGEKAVRVRFYLDPDEGKRALEALAE